MSISSIVLGNSASVKEKLGEVLRVHGHELIVGAIMTTISVTIAFAATGDLNQALAGRHR
jgi:hypothetical protein